MPKLSELSEKETGVMTRANAHKLSGRYSAEVQRLVVATLMATGSVAETARQTGVAERTIRVWRQSARWWQREVQRVEHAREMQITHKYRSIMDKALDQLEDRVDHGDTMLDRRGELIRVPVKARDLATILSNLATRHEQAEAQSVREHAASTLDQLRDQFKSFAKEYRTGEGRADNAPNRTGLPRVSHIVADQ